MVPVVTLASGVRVANFSSPHPFHFDDGTTLGACTGDRARELMLDSAEDSALSECGRWIDVRLAFRLSEVVAKALNDMASLDVDIILVPLPVMTAVMASDETRINERVLHRLRTCRVADRVTKTISATRFCVGGAS